MRRSRLRESGKCWRTSTRNSMAGKTLVSVRDRGPHDVLGQRFARLGGAGRNTDRCAETNTTVSPRQWGFQRANCPELSNTMTAEVRMGLPAAAVVKSRTNPWTRRLISP